MVLPVRDHREVSFHAEAFAEMAARDSGNPAPMIAGGQRWARNPAAGELAVVAVGAGAGAGL